MALATAAAAAVRCALCECKLDTPLSIDAGLCRSCVKRPEAARLSRDASGRAIRPARPAAPQLVPKPRSFSPAEKSLIKSVHGYMPALDLLRILNERLGADRPDAAPWTIEQLQTELQDQMTPVPEADWTQLRQLLAQARRLGLLEHITPQVLEDFSVVFSLTPAAAMHLRDVIASAQRASARGTR